MQKMAEKRKTIIALGMVVLMTATSLFALVLHSQAQNTMSGVEEAVSQKKSYEILEIAPQREQGNMGYLVSGQEPVYLTDRLYQWLEEKQQDSEFVNSQQARMEYVAELYQKLELRAADVSLGESAARYPLSYFPYQESYVPLEGYQELVFPEGMQEQVVIDDEAAVVDRIYYKGGFSNHDWFVNNVFGVDNSADALPVHVTTITAAEVEEAYLQQGISFLQQFDMLVVGTGVSKELSGAVRTMVEGTSQALLVEQQVAADFFEQEIAESCLFEKAFVYQEQMLSGQGFLQALPEEVQENFTPVYQRMEIERIVKGSDGEVNPAVVLQYLIQQAGMEKSGILAPKETLRILELEPGYSFSLMLTAEDLSAEAEDGSEFLPTQELYIKSTGVEKLERLKQLLLKAQIVTEDVSIAQLYELSKDVTGFSTAAFSSMDINVWQEYDLIYLGANTGTKNRDAAGNTIYNDTAKNGLIYQKDGDLSGDLQGNRYGSNDIGKSAMWTLMNAAEAYCPVVIEETLYNGVNVNAETVESGSYLYQWLEEVKYLPNVYTTQEFIESVGSSAYANLKKPRLLVEKKKEQENLLVNFSIEDKLGFTNGEPYELELFFDWNGNGLYEESEQVSAVQLVNQYGEAIEKEENGAFLVRGDRTYYLNYHPQMAGNTNVSYRIRCQVGGFIELWEDGQCAVTAEKEKETVRVLQIKKDEDLLELQYNRLFQLLCDNEKTQNYRIATKTVTTAQYMEQFAAGAAIGQDLLEQYDVLVLSGLDITTEASADNILGYDAKEAILRFAQGGHSVILLGDVQQDEIYQELTGMVSLSDHSLNDTAPEGMLYSLSEASGIANRPQQGTAVMTKQRNSSIASYPYVIPDEWSTEHLVYPQMALDISVSGVQVWYGIDDIQDESGSSLANPYKADRGNMRNNYFLYSYDNITYCGINWADTVTDITSEDVLKQENYGEWKLLVNAIIAGYNNGVKRPDVTILQGNTISSGAKDVEYLLLDQQMELEEAIEEGITERDMTFCFSLEDSNISQKMESVSVCYYIADENGTEYINGNIPARKLGTDGYLTTQAVVNGQVQGAETNNQLKSGNVYQVTIPEIHSELGEKGYADIYVEAIGYYEKDGVETGVKGYAKITLTQIQLFDLD